MSLSINGNLNLSEENLHRSLFSTSDVKQCQIARTVRHNSKGNISREAFRDSEEKYSHEIFFHSNDQFQHELFLTNKITIFRNSRTES